MRNEIPQFEKRSKGKPPYVCAAPRLSAKKKRCIVMDRLWAAGFSADVRKVLNINVISN